MKPLRIFAIALGLVIALIAAGAGLLYAMFDGEKIKAEASRAIQEKTGRQLQMAGPVQLSVWPEVGIRLGRTTLSDPGGTGEFMALDSARVAVAVMPLLSKQVQVRRVELDGLRLTVAKRKDGTLSIADLTGGDKTPATPGSSGGGSPAPLQLDVEGISVRNAQFTWRDEKAGSTTTISNLDLSSGRIAADGGRKSLVVDALALSARGKAGTDAFEVRLEAPKLMLTPDKSGGETLSLATRLSGSGREANVKLMLAGVEGNAKALKIAKFALDLDALANGASLKGRLESPVAADIAALTLTLDKLAGRLEVAHPQMPMKQLALPLDGRLHADFARQSAALQLKTAFDESKIGLKLDVAKFAPLALGFDLDVDQFNLDKYLPPPAAEDKAPKQDKLDFSPLKGHDVRGTVRIGALQASKLKISKLNATLKLAGGRLEVAPLSLVLYEGSANGRVALDANGNKLALAQNLTGISINPLLKDLAGKDLIEGRGSVVIDVTSQGASVAEMKKALAGTANVNFKDGAIKGINLAQALRDAKAKLGAKQDSTQQAKAGEKTDFSELTASLKIAGGVARNEDLAMKSPFLRLGGAGDIDIGNSQMNYLAKVSVVASAAGQGGQGLEHLKGLTVPVRVSGPFEGLSYKLEFGSLVADAAKAKVEEKKEEVKAKAEQQVKDKLKGLFGK